MLAERLVDGYYVTGDDDAILNADPGSPDLWFGPGLPALLTPLVAVDAPLSLLRLTSALVLFAAVLLMYVLARERWGSRWGSPPRTGSGSTSRSSGCSRTCTARCSPFSSSSWGCWDSRGSSIEAGSCGSWSAQPGWRPGAHAGRLRLGAQRLRSSCSSCRGCCSVHARRAERRGRRALARALRAVARLHVHEDREAFRVGQLGQPLALLDDLSTRRGPR